MMKRQTVGDHNICGRKSVPKQHCPPPPLPPPSPDENANPGVNVDIYGTYKQEAEVLAFSGPDENVSLSDVSRSKVSVVDLDPYCTSIKELSRSGTAF